MCRSMRATMHTHVSHHACVAPRSTCTGAQICTTVYVSLNESAYLRTCHVSSHVVCHVTPYVSLMHVRERVSLMVRAYIYTWASLHECAYSVSFNVRAHHVSFHLYYCAHQHLCVSLHAKRVKTRIILLLCGLMDTFPCEKTFESRIHTADTVQYRRHSTGRGPGWQPTTT